jgi:hypothetical protein
VDKALRPWACASALVKRSHPTPYYMERATHPPSLPTRRRGTSQAPRWTAARDIAA